MMQDDGNTNGNGQPGTKGKRANMGDFLGIKEAGGGGFDPVFSMFEAPDEFAELAARARVSKKDVADILVILGRRQRLKRGYTDVVDLVGKKLQLSIGEDGKARQETVQMYTGGLQARNPMPFAVPNIVDKMRTNGASDRGGPET